MLTYKYIFFPHVRYGLISNCQQAAINAGYRMFLWNDRIYNSWTCEDTGKTVKDIQ